ncbi:hypothetical protein PILCRDRAFT_828677 [Piloderma croceum F 1598]|uniref:Uncharacterized protein n=1 Tax=Piloderma croceum (strain F 1598) TaxID=765440 RepID=A0A0C3F1U3_PILCF|nr:hypothetical protein PILCRDRAFT_828677 [Piloderma croceum F 1598]
MLVSKLACRATTVIRSSSKEVVDLMRGQLRCQISFDRFAGGLGYRFYQGSMSRPTKGMKVNGRGGKVKNEEGR